MSLTIAGSSEDKTIVFTDTELQEIIAMFDEGDRVAVEKELQKRARNRRPNELINVHIFTLIPFRASVVIGNVEEDWWVGTV